jgi:hypothetical protein
MCRCTLRWPAITMNDSKRVVILITVHQPTFTPLEEISLRQCFKVLGHYPIKLVCPEGMDTSAYRRVIPQIEVDPIPPHWQSSYANFTLMKIEPFLYRRYQQYEYVLFYELDAFVFRDDLAHWCDAGLDYIGAPWFEGMVAAKDNAAVHGVGNGGFSLRKVSAMLRGRLSKRLWLRLLLSEARRKPLQALRRFLVDLPRIAIGKDTTIDYARGEDSFWGLVVNRHLPWFKVASFDEARQFSFETLPRRLYRLNGERLPFGCHAWTRYDLDFFRPHVEACGYSLEGLVPRATFHTLEKVD